MRSAADWRFLASPVSRTVALWLLVASGWLLYIEPAPYDLLFGLASS